MDAPVKYGPNHLTYERRQMLEAWLRPKAEELIASRPAKTTVALAATEALGFRITKTNIRALCIHLRIKWKEKFTQPGKKRRPKIVPAAELSPQLPFPLAPSAEVLSRLEKLETNYAGLQSEHVKLCQAVRTLCLDLGVPESTFPEVLKGV